jgi:hypothetical protein
MTQGRLQVSGPHVVHDEIDGEVVVINFATGSYYSLTATAVPIWALLRSGATAEEAVAVIEAGFATDGHDVAAAVQAFLTELEREGLIAAAPTGDGPDGSAVAASPSTAAEPYVAPVVEKFTDMEDLILLDPVHDVSQAGWPNAAAGGESATR